ncbi:ComF family protein [Massilia dura]|uniref:ComF family protein n=2 Tax=Pseudoduganella dura TaxID=321982 RepID=A0A6I3XG63_9BURK|nr:ComF family protein [Pseudoduganella dura]GGY17236.1 amidophosphoribosyltransferase [Pseudoduganella dura]
MATAMAKALAGPLSALLPCPCVLCGAHGRQALCPPCRAQFAGATEVRCPVCADPLPAGSGVLVCGTCLARRPAYDATLVAAAYAPPWDRLVLELKFGGQLAHARLFAELLADAVRALPSALPPAVPPFVAPTLLCPVPLGPGRLAERGFNQALEIARPLGRLLGIAVAPRLAVRVQETSAQSTLHGSRRRANVAHVFAVPDRALVEGRHIGIVDDVMSSGQTLGELAAVFKRHGAARVTNLVFARTPPRR